MNKHTITVDINNVFLQDLIIDLVNRIGNKWQLTYDESCDVVSESIMGASKKIPFKDLSPDNHTDFEKLSNRIARNKAVDMLRRKRRYETRPFDKLEGAISTRNKRLLRPPEEKLLFKEKIAQFEDYLGTLSFRNQTIMSLHIEGYNSYEIANMLGLNITPKRISNIIAETKKNFQNLI